MRRFALVLVAACGGDPPAPDAPPIVTPRCDPEAPFQAPVPVEGLNTDRGDASARLSPDELVVVFARRSSTGFWDLYTASRPSRDTAFGAPSLLATVNSVSSDLWPTMTPDGLLLMFDSDRGTSVSHIYVSRRSSTTEPFDAPSAAPALMDRELHPLLANGRALYFSSDVRTGQGLHDIWRAEIDSTGATSTPMAVLGGVNSPEDEVVPVVTEDELLVFFRRTVGTEHDIFTASRSTAQDGFGSATPVAVLSMAGINEVPNWVSADGCVLYFHSDATGGMGAEDIYVARRGDI